MNSAGYDWVVEIGEGLLNRSLAAAYTLADIAHLAGGRAGRFEYEVELEEPPTIHLLTERRLGSLLIQPAPDRKVRVDLRAAVKLKALGLWFRFELIAAAVGALRYDPASQELKLDARSLTLSDIGFENQTGWLQIAFLRIELPRVVLGWFNTALKTVIQTGLLERYESIKVAAFSLELWQMPAGDENKLTIQVKDIQVLPHDVLGVAANLLGAVSANPGSLADFSRGRDFGASLSDAALLRVFDFWWDRTTWTKQTGQQGQTTTHLKEVDSLVSLFAGAGFDFDTLVDYSFALEFGRPGIDLRNDNTVRIGNWMLGVNAKAIVSLKLRVEVTPDVKKALALLMTARDLTWEGNLIRVKVFSTKGQFTIKNAVAELGLDESYRLRINILKADVDFSGEGWWAGCLSLLTAFVSDGLKKCTFPLSPSLSVVSPPDGGIRIQLREPELVWDASEVTLRAGLAAADIPKTTPSTPRFVAVRNAVSTRKSLVHRAGCPRIAEAAEKEKLGYYTLFEAFQDGFSGCRACHTDIHGITVSAEPVEIQEAAPAGPGSRAAPAAGRPPAEP